MSRVRGDHVVWGGILLALAYLLRNQLFSPSGGSAAAEETVPSTITVEGLTCFVDGVSRNCETLPELFVAGETVRLDSTHGQHGLTTDLIAALEARGVTVHVLDE